MARSLECRPTARCEMVQFGVGVFWAQAAFRPRRVHPHIPPVCGGIGRTGRLAGKARGSGGDHGDPLSAAVAPAACTPLAWIWTRRPAAERIDSRAFVVAADVSG